METNKTTNETYRKDTIEEFINKLSSNNHIPSGGGAVALNCALASSLGNMVCKLTKKPKGISFENLATNMQIETYPIMLDKITNKYLDYIQEDADMFNQLMESYKLPKDTEEQREIRYNTIQDGYKLAIQVPIKICELSYELYDILMELAVMGNINLLSDVAIATRTLYSATRNSMINIKINLNHMDDSEYVKEINEFWSKIKDDNEEFKNNILSICDEKLGFEV